MRKVYYETYVLCSIGMKLCIVKKSLPTLNRIYCLQKCAMRAITNSDYRAHSAPLFSKLKNLDIYQINTFQVAKFMYCYHNHLLP